MKNIEVKSFQKALLNWYQTHKRQLPWRETKDPYRIWISEVMAQQTQIDTVIPYFKRFIQRFPDMKTLAEADLQDVLKLWEGLGYYSRARNMHKAAKSIIEKYSGCFPENYEEILLLPGVGKYIAAAISSIAFSKPHAVLDGNVKRVLSRLTCSEKPINDSKSQKHYHELADSFLDTHNPGDYNQSLMELGAIICKPANPVCHDCPVINHCRVYRKNMVEKYPKKLQKQKIPSYNIATGVIRKDNKILITKRKEAGLLGGLWEFPGGKLHNDESAEEACVREIREETGLLVKIDCYLTHVRHAYSHFKIEVDVFICDYQSGEVVLNGPVDFRWISIKEIDDYPFPKANHKFFSALKIFYKI